MSQIRRPASADFVIALIFSAVLAGCSDGQQSDLVSKMKALMGGQSVTPAIAVEPDYQQVRQSKLNELHKKAETGDVLAMVEIGNVYEDGQICCKLSSSIPSRAVVTGGEPANNDPVDLKNSAEWYEKAALQGNVVAQERLGVFYSYSKIWLRLSHGGRKPQRKAAPLLSTCLREPI